jgi:hypothetical protein
MAEAAARPDAGEKEAFLELRLKTDDGRDFPRAIPKEAKAKESEKDISFGIRLLAEEKKIFVSKFC